MAKTINRLSARDVQTITKQGRHNDGGGLYLIVDKSSAKRWAIPLTINGKRRAFGLGPLHKVTLQGARAKAAEHARVIRH